MFKVYEFEILSRKFNHYVQKRFTRASLVSSKPIIEMLEYYMKNCRKGFDDNLLAIVAQQLGHLIKSLRTDN